MEPRNVQQLPSATFKLSPDHLDWIARRAAELGMTKTDFLRSLLDRDRSECAGTVEESESLVLAS